MTQDALPKDQTRLQNLLTPLKEEPRIAAVGGRQIAFPFSARYEQLVRSYNYPPGSHVWGKEQIGLLGVRAFLLSDVFAFDRKSAYLAAGGFDHPILTNEGMLMTQRLLDSGFLVAYAADACVYHSHDFTWKQQYHRNYIVGQTLQRHQTRFQGVQEYVEGKKLAMSVFKTLIKEGRILECIGFEADCSARLLGNRMGKNAEKRKAMP